jgi:outer membrane protein assembly factor BamB
MIDVKSAGGDSAHALSVAWVLTDPTKGTPVSDGERIFAISGDHRLIAVAKDSGVKVWDRRIRGLDPGFAGFGLALAGSTIIAGDYELTAFDSTTGAFRWRFRPGAGYGAGNYVGAVIENTLFAGSPAGRLYAIAADTGDSVWTYRLTGDGISTVFAPVAGRDSVVAAYTHFTAPPTGGIICLDRRSGVERWRREFTARGEALSLAAAGGAIIVRDTVVVADATGSISAFALRNGAPEWRIPVDGKPQGPPAIDFRALAADTTTLYAASLSGVVSAYNLKDRSLKWAFDGRDNGSAGFQMTLEGDTLYVPFFGTGVIGLRSRDGVESWRAPAPFTGGEAPPVKLSNLLLLSSPAGLAAFKGLP